MVVVFDIHPIYLCLTFLGCFRDTLSHVSWSYSLQCICISLTPSTKVITLKIHPGSFWVTGVKRSFSLKCRNSSMLHSMTIRLIHVYQLETLYLCYGVKMPIWGQLGSLGSKRSKTQKRYSSYRSQGMIMRLMYLHQQDPLYKRYHFKNSSGVIWGLRGQKLIFTKNALTHPCYIA